MTEAVASVLAGESRYAVACSDALAFLKTLPDDSLDLIVTSPPYEDARTYGVDFRVKGQEWVAWMVGIVRECSRVCKGLIAVNCEGRTRNYSYSGVPFLLFADLLRAGFNMRKPVVYHRVGIPGGGGPDWLRNDWEPIICVTRPGRLPWSDNTAEGHPPKWAPGGEMSYRQQDGSRRNDPICDWCKCYLSKHGEPGVSEMGGPNDRLCPVRGITSQFFTQVRKPVIRVGGERNEEKQRWIQPDKANPGNVIRCNAGGGLMGHPLAHENEAPFPLELPRFFVRSFCPPDGIVCDPFSGSGTTLQAAIEAGRRFVGCDLRQSQVDLAYRRIAATTPALC